MNTNRRTANRRPPCQGGFTLVEGAICVAIASVIVSALLPSFTRMRQLRHLEGAAAQLETDVQHARSLAVTRGQTLRMSFVATSDATCYVVHTGNGTDCSCAADGTAQCVGAEVLRSVRYADRAPLRLTSNSRSIAFDAVKGTVTPTATVQISGQGGDTLREIVNVMGRTRACTTTGVPGYKAC